MEDTINQDYLKLLDGNFPRIFTKLGSLQFMKVKNNIEMGCHIPGRIYSV